MTALAIAGWALALLAGWRLLALRRRLELVACAEHELRGPLAALTLAAARERPLMPAVVEGQLERARAGLADLSAARCGRRAPAGQRAHDPRGVAERAAAGWHAAGGQVALDWRAEPALVEGDAARLSQALGNLIGNALEHGRGPVTVRGLSAGRKLKIEVADRGSGFGVRRRRAGRGRGRGLAIASRAALDAGGRLTVAPTRDETVVALELPLAEG